MTYSVIAVEPDSGRVGSAIASRFLAVGSYCLYLDPAAGAVVTQGIANPVLGVRGLAALTAGEPPGAILDRLLAADPGIDHRQIHLMDLAGRQASRTGAACGAWAGTLSGEHLSLAGNLLAGAPVLAAMRDAWAAAPDRAMAERLLDALAAGEAAGGDWRGVQAAAIQVYCGEIYPELDLRVDDCAGSAVNELQRLYRRSLAADVQSIRDVMPRRTLAADGPVYPTVGDLSAVRSKDPGDGGF